MADAEVAVVDVREENETGKTDKKKKEPVEKEPTASLSELYQYASVSSFWHPHCLYLRRRLLASASP